MFATLIVARPSLHTGGALEIRHRGREARLDLRCSDFSEIAWAAFYADCVHEVLPVTSGCRLALVYNLLRPGKGRLPRPPSYEQETAALGHLLQQWCDPSAPAGEDRPVKLVYPLEHAYTPAELSFTALKGADAAAAGVLAAAACAAACDLHVALLRIEESGAAEYSGYPGSRWSRRYHDDDDDGEDRFRVAEVFERSLTLSHWPRSSAATSGRPWSCGRRRGSCNCWRVPDSQLRCPPWAASWPRGSTRARNRAARPGARPMNWPRRCSPAGPCGRPARCRKGVAPKR